jgi:hypothetical protein
MSEISNEPTIIPTQQAAGFVVPSVGPDGAPLSEAEQFQTMLKNPAWVNETLTPGTPAAAWLDGFNRRAAGMPLAPPIGSGPPTPTVQPSDFTIPVPHGVEMPAEADMAMRGWLVAAGVDRETGSSLASLAAERIAHWERLDDWSNAAEESEAVLRSVYGEDYEASLEAAQRYVAHIEQAGPGFVEFMSRTGLDNDATFIYRLMTLAAQQGI